MTKPVIVGTDFGPDSPQILEVGRRLAAALGGHLVLVHAVEPIENPERADSDIEDFHDRLMQKAEEHMAQERDRWPGDVDLCTLVKLGSRVDVLLSLVEERQALMLVVGSPFRGGPPVGIGLQLVARCRCPLVIVPTSELSS